MKSKTISLILSIFLIFETIPAYAVTSAAQLSETAHKAYNQSNFLKSAEYYEKAYSLEKNKVFIDNAITSYSSYAFNLANEKKYDEAIKYCKKVLSMRPAEKNAKELLSDIYYSRSSDYFYNGNPEKAKEDLENALKYSVFPEQAQKAREGLLQLKNSENQFSSAEFLPATVSSSGSIPELVKLLELKIYGKSQDKLPVTERVQKLEKDIFNKNYNDESLTLRLDRLKKTVLPELAQKQVNNFKQEQDYIEDIIEQSNGTARIFGKMPIRIYIDDANVKTYKKYYIDAVKDAMKDWETASGGKIKFEITNDTSRSNIKIVWIDYFEDFAWQPELKKEDMSAEKQKTNYKKANTFVQIGSIAAMVLGSMVGIPAIGMVGSIGGSVASPILQYKSLDLNNGIMQVKINTGCTANMTKEQSIAKIKQITMHQLGHSLGIYGHSPDSNDIMYSNFSVNKLSDRDKNTIKEIYKDIKPNGK